MTTQHTPGKLVHCKLGYPHADITAANGRRVAITWGIASNQPRTKAAADKRNAESRENARRLVACWNACDGLTTEHLENIDMLGGTLAGRFAAFHASERELMDTRDELLEALKGLLSGMFDGPDESDAAALVTKARAAIAKAEGAA